MRRRSGTGGFAVFGNDEPVTLFTRKYLGEVTQDRIELSKTWHWGFLAQTCRTIARQRGLVVFTGDAAPRALDGDLLDLEDLLSISVPLPATVAAYRRCLVGRAQRNLRYVRSAGYRHEVSQDASWSNEFYERFHLPSMRDRHGDDGFVSTPAQITDWFQRGACEWLRIFDDEICVAALLAERRQDTYHMHRLGWRDGSPDLLRSGAAAALYWFGAGRAIELGLARLDLEGVSPDLENGLFAFKSSWGGRIDSRICRFSRRRLLLDPSNQEAQDFIKTRSLLARDRANRFIVLSGRAPAESLSFPAQAEAISAWFRLRSSPCPSPSPENDALPVSLRPWFDALPLHVADSAKQKTPCAVSANEV